MSAALDQLLNRYEQGQISRRDLLGALTALVAMRATEREASAGRAPLAPTVGPVKSMNHVSIFVPDVQKSRKFYQDVFGLPLLTNQEPGVNLSTGSSFLGIYPLPADAQERTGSINHLCLGVENFDADAVLKTLQDLGLPARIRLRGDTKELYLTDPDGISVQLQHTRYIGGTGPLGDRQA